MINTLSLELRDSLNIKGQNQNLKDIIGIHNL